MMTDSTFPAEKIETALGLTEAQKQCLRLYRQYDAKEIARQLDVSPATVHQRLTAARKKLGVERSIEAARILAGAEGGPLYDPIVYDRVDVADAFADAPPPWLSRLPWPVPTDWRPWNDLSYAERLVAIFGIIGTFMGVVVFYVLAVKLFMAAF